MNGKWRMHSFCACASFIHLALFSHGSISAALTDTRRSKITKHPGRSQSLRRLVKVHHTSSNRVNETFLLWVHNSKPFVFMNCATTSSDLHFDNIALQEVGLFTVDELSNVNDPEHEDQYSLQTWTTWSWFWMKWTWDADSGTSVWGLGHSWEKLLPCCDITKLQTSWQLCAFL